MALQSSFCLGLSKKILAMLSILSTVLLLLFTPSYHVDLGLPIYVLLSGLILKRVFCSSSSYAGQYPEKSVVLHNVDDI
jgi:hypothetical protein